MARFEEPHRNRNIIIIVAVVKPVGYPESEETHSPEFLVTEDE
jgi:hypothetical protein